MIITNETLGKFIDIDKIDRKELSITLSKIGLEVEAEYDIKIPKNVIVAKVIKKTRHPNADKLSLCEVDTGKEIVQIVCGAKNVAVNQFVALALPGAVLPIGENGLEIKESDIRGTKSYGMLCSSTELGLPKLNDGIMELDSSIGDLKLGVQLSEYPIFNQFVLELGITPNRGDCLYVLGVARDIASFFNLIVKNIIVTEPGVALGVGRFLQVVPNGNITSSLFYKIVEIKEEKLPLEIALSLGICGRYKDNVIQDFLEYANYMSGVLFNAYPMDSKDISSDGEKAKLIIKPNDSGLECVYSEIRDSDLVKLNELSTVGASTYKESVHDYPRTFILEASFIESEKIANFLYNVDKSKFTKEVMHRSTRGTNPDLELGMNFLCSNLNKIEVMLYSGAQKIVHSGSEPINIHMTFGYVSDCIGNEIPKEDIAIILKRLNFRIQATCDENFFIAQPPLFRNDIKNRQDIAEEVLRLYGVDKVKPNIHTIAQTTQFTPALVKHNKLKIIRNKALAHGYIECIHYVFDNSSVLKELGFEYLKDEKSLINPITQELDTLRPSLLPHILESMRKNKNHGYDCIKLFEIGYVYDSDREARLKAAFAISGSMLGSGYPYPKGMESNFYLFAQNISEIIGNFECTNISTQFIKNRLIHPYKSGNMIKSGNLLGVISKLHPNIEDKYDLDSVFFCEIDMDMLLGLQDSTKMAKTFSKYQSNKRDLTILINKNISFNAIRMEISKADLKYIKNIFPLDVFNENEEQNALSIRFIFQSMEHTLSESEMQEELDKVLNILNSKFNAVIKN